MRPVNESYSLQKKKKKRVIEIWSLYEMWEFFVEPSFNQKIINNYLQPIQIHVGVTMSLQISLIWLCEIDTSRSLKSL